MSHHDDGAGVCDSLAATHASPLNWWCMQRWPVYILAGGRSSRFGSDKARALLGGEPLIARLARQVGPAALTITVVADAADKYADLGLRTIADRRPGLGPLVGIESALLNAQNPPKFNMDWIIVFSCDLTFVAPAWIDLLAAGRCTGALVAAFADAGGRRHPFPGLYYIGLLAAVQHYLNEGRRAVHQLIESVDHVDLSVPGDWPEVAQINTMEDLKRASVEPRGASPPR